jgi:hypothetical protein
MSFPEVFRKCAIRSDADREKLCDGGADRNPRAIDAAGQPLKETCDGEEKSQEGKEKVGAPLRDAGSSRLPSLPPLQFPQPFFSFTQYR